eukprot:scaffold191709_cov25-Prasinocladus_malaysianus.AAC.2
MISATQSVIFMFDRRLGTSNTAYGRQGYDTNLLGCFGSRLPELNFDDRIATTNGKCACGGLALIYTPVTLGSESCQAMAHTYAHIEGKCAR